jgi:hypothetical protein
VKRRLFNLSAALSLALCLATVAQWVRSVVYHNYLEGVRYAGATQLWVHSRGGSFRISITLDEPLHESGWKVVRANMSTPRAIDVLGRRPYRGLEGEFGSTAPKRRWSPMISLDRTNLQTGQWRHGGRLIIVIWSGYWLPALAASALPALWVFRRLRRRRRLEGNLCLNCGYDLRATPACCPECGTTAPEAPSTDRAADEARADPDYRDHVVGAVRGHARPVAFFRNSGSYDQILWMTT